MTRNEKLREILEISKKHNKEVNIIGTDFQIKGLVDNIYFHTDVTVIFSKPLGFIAIHFDKITSII